MSSMVPCAPRRARIAFVESAVSQLGGVADVGADFFAKEHRFFDSWEKSMSEP